jgi:arylsulfatase A-like enzyme
MRFILPLLLVGIAGTAVAADRPNILLVITDDQGFGDLGTHGNPVVRTPNLDAFAKQSTRLKNFYVCPVCSPTRASLLTGLYNYRTGVVDTFLGRSLMRPGIPTLADHLAKAGYRTGLFGKWHLGDNYPLRPEDRGFQHTLWSQGGGLAQPSDAPDLDPKTAYFDPILKKDGKEVKTKGYCTDVFTDAAVEFIRGAGEKPFFAYVAYNAPHAPLQVDEKLVEPYRKRDLTPTGFPKAGQPWAGANPNVELIAKTYAMVENVDTNFIRLLKALDESKKAENTIVVFLTDNGPDAPRYNGGLRGRKGSVFEGGIRVPCYVRIPGMKETVETPAAHIDMTPTLLAACGVAVPPGLDGRVINLDKVEKPPDRTLFFQWHRGDVPEKGRAFAARGPRYKLVQANGVQPNAAYTPKYELFDIPNDPYEQTDLAAKLPDEVAKLKGEYEAWFKDVTKLGFDPPRIVIGNEKEPITRLSRQDWRGPKASWSADGEGYWEVTIERAGLYRVGVMSRTEFDGATVTLGSTTYALQHPPGVKTSMAGNLKLDRGDLRVSSAVTLQGKKRGAEYVELQFLGDK